MKDLHLLPKVRDSWSYLYVERCRVDQEDKAIAIQDASGKVPVPCASLTLLMLGPGTTVTHAAMRVLAENGCLVAWTGEEGVRLYAQGIGETRSARNLYRQVRLWADPAAHLDVVIRMYQKRFDERLEGTETLREIRGKEGMRVRRAYARASRETGLEWSGRDYRRDRWTATDPLNRALSCANSCLYGVCHAAIVSAGYSPALGFVHTGKMLSFVYDVADLYKTETTIPTAFHSVAAGTTELECRVRHACRDAFHQARLLDRIVADIDELLAKGEVPTGENEEGFDTDEGLPGGWWDPDSGSVAGGINPASDEGLS